MSKKTETKSNDLEFEEIMEMTKTVQKELERDDINMSDVDKESMIKETNVLNRMWELNRKDNNNTLTKDEMIELSDLISKYEKFTDLKVQKIIDEQNNNNKSMHNNADIMKALSVIINDDEEIEQYRQIATTNPSVIKNAIIRNEDIIKMLSSLNEIEESNYNLDDLDLYIKLVEESKNSKVTPELIDEMIWIYNKKVLETKEQLAKYRAGIKQMMQLDPRSSRLTLGNDNLTLTFEDLDIHVIHAPARYLKNYQYSDLISGNLYISHGDSSVYSPIATILQDCDIDLKSFVVGEFLPETDKIISNRVLGVCNENGYKVFYIPVQYDYTFRMTHSAGNMWITSRV